MLMRHYWKKPAGTLKNWSENLQHYRSFNPKNLSYSTGSRITGILLQKFLWILYRSITVRSRQCLTCKKGRSTKLTAYVLMVQPKYLWILWKDIWVFRKEAYTKRNVYCPSAKELQNCPLYRKKEHGM